MKPRNWLLLILLPLMVAVSSLAPFLPGPGNEFSYSISRFAQTIGYICLPFVPFGLFWLIIELRNKKGQSLNRWTNGYYPSWLTLIPVFIFLPLKIISTIISNESFYFFPFIVIISITGFLIFHIQKLYLKTEYKFNPAPIYIVLIPVISMVISKFALEKTAALTREKAIMKTEFLISAIEKYKEEKGDYPESLKSLVGEYIPEIPTPTLMGTRAYQYEKLNDNFQLTFERRWHWNATEVVVYNRRGKGGLQDNYENHATNHRNWWYHLAD